ncbi:MAG: glycosyltransferase [bacterium]|nr:glycosyltransferase [bacterium]
MSKDSTNANETASTSKKPTNKKPNNRVVELLYKTFTLLKSNGFKDTISKILGWFETKQIINSISRDISLQQRNFEESYNFKNDIKISIVVPLYNTPKDFLAEMICSVQNQTYKNWELCLADGSSDDFGFVGDICRKFADKDNRIIYRKLHKNEGISANTNQSIKMSSGEYIALFDHDDILHPSALFECMKAIDQQSAEYVYTDEAVFMGNSLKNIFACHYKPDFAKDNLLTNNYICHFSVFKKSLIEKVGYFRDEYNGSQDHDMILRLTDAAKTIVHVPKILYFWRSHPDSVAMDISHKTYAINAGINAVHDFLDSKLIIASVVSSQLFPTIYYIEYELKNHTTVSIVITNQNNYCNLKRCINSILELSTYSNFEIIIIDTGSCESDILKYYNHLCQHKNINIIYSDNQLNYSTVNEYVNKHCNNDYLLFLNSDTQIITPDWIEQLLMFTQRDDVGATGAKIYSGNNVWHAGIILGLGPDRIAGYSCLGINRDDPGYSGRASYAQNVSAVSCACLMVKRSDFIDVGGFDQEFSEKLNEVDFCLKLRQKGLLNIFNAFCELNIFNCENDRVKKDTLEKCSPDEKESFQNKWENLLKNDPFYNPNFSLDQSYKLKRTN